VDLVKVGKDAPFGLGPHEVDGCEIDVALYVLSNDIDAVVYQCILSAFFSFPESINGLSKTYPDELRLDDQSLEESSVSSERSFALDPAPGLAYHHGVTSHDTKLTTQ